MTPAPIVLFAYNRPALTIRTVEALLGNELACKSDLFIYSDGPGDDQQEANVYAVREYVHGISGFKTVTIIERESNWGLSKSIIEGVTSVINQYGKVIVLEDDIVASPCFLSFMNQALAFYSGRKKVWHISGWNYPIAGHDPKDTFLWRVMNCWGWATWADRWEYFEKDTGKLLGNWSKADIKRFNIDGAAKDYWRQVVANHEGEINTWAIFWYATIFQQNGLCLNPAKTFVDNIGFNSGGVHCHAEKPYIDVLNQEQSFNFPTEMVEADVFFKEIKRYLHVPLIQKIRRRLVWK